MVSMGDDRRHKFYKIKDMPGFEKEVGCLIDGVDMPIERFDQYLNRLPFHSARVNKNLDYRILRLN